MFGVINLLLFFCELNEIQHRGKLAFFLFTNILLPLLFSFVGFFFFIYRQETRKEIKLGVGIISLIACVSQIIYWLSATSPFGKKFSVTDDFKTDLIIYYTTLVFYYQIIFLLIFSINILQGVIRTSYKIQKQEMEKFSFSNLDFTAQCIIYSQIFPFLMLLGQTIPMFEKREIFVGIVMIIGLISILSGLLGVILKNLSMLIIYNVGYFITIVFLDIFLLNFTGGIICSIFIIISILATSYYTYSYKKYFRDQANSMSINEATEKQDSIKISIYKNQQ